jgi:hypothetical protein
VFQRVAEQEEEEEEEEVVEEEDEEQVCAPRCFRWLVSSCCAGWVHSHHSSSKAALACQASSATVLVHPFIRLCGHGWRVCRPCQLCRAN